MDGVDILRIGRFEAPPATISEREVNSEHPTITWFSKGTSTLEAAGQTYEVPPNTVTVHPPYTRYRYYSDSLQVTRMGYVVFTSAPAEEWPLIRCLSPDDVVIALLNHIAWLNGERPDGWEGQARAALAYMLRAYRSGASATSSLRGSPLPPPIERSMAFVRSRWVPGAPFETPSLEALANAAHVTREHLCRVFKKELGSGPITALRLLRLRHTAELLTRTTMSVGEIAAAGGFDSQFHFSRSFKQSFGFSPSEFRRAAPHHVPSLPDPLERLWLHL